MNGAKSENHAPGAQLGPCLSQTAHLEQHHADVVDQSDVFKDLQSVLVSPIQLFNIT